MSSGPEILSFTYTQVANKPNTYLLEISAYATVPGSEPFLYQFGYVDLNVDTDIDALDRNTDVYSFSLYTPFTEGLYDLLTFRGIVNAACSLVEMNHSFSEFAYKLPYLGHNHF